MQVGEQILKPGSFNSHLTNRLHRKEKAKRIMQAGLMLTSMVDMFALLVIFLLQSFSATPELIIPNGVTLPIAQTGKDIETAPVLALTKDGVFLDNTKVGQVDSITKEPDTLLDKLQAIREGWQRDNKDQNFPGKIHLQADKGISSTVISTFMGIVSSEHFSEIQLAVISGGNAGR